jgi:hypothetical protein
MAHADHDTDKTAEISDQDLDQVVGGDATNALPAVQNNALPAVQNNALPAVQSLGIGSQSSGAGAGKVTFNPFSITR